MWTRLYGTFIASSAYGEKDFGLWPRSIISHLLEKVIDRIVNVSAIPVIVSGVCYWSSDAVNAGMAKQNEERLRPQFFGWLVGWLFIAHLWNIYFRTPV